MKKISLKIIAVMLVVCMVFPFVPMWAIAGDTDAYDENAKSVTFKLEIVSETPDSVVVSLALTEGQTLCFDASFEADSSLRCDEIDFSKSLKDFAEENPNGVLLANNATGKLSFANTKEISAPTAIAEITYSKVSAKGISISDISANVEACYSFDESLREVEANVTVVNGLPQTHTHVESDSWVETEPATCQHGGVKVMYCLTCGEICKTMDTAQTDHTKENVRVEPSCEQDGYVAEICTSCKQEFSRTVLPKTGHKNTVDQHKDATCTENGYDRVFCNDCQKVISENVILAEGHKTVVDEKPATCTEDGYYKETCTVCQQVIKDEVLKASGHNVVVDEKPATCTEDGYRKETCSVCKEVLLDIVIPATNHKNTEVQHKDATCTEDGYDRVVCKDCNEIISETVISASGHKIVTEDKAATCTENGYHKEHCSVCNEVLADDVIEATGHQHKRTETQAATCTESGYIKEYCTDCDTLIKETVLEAKGHKFVKDVKQATCTEDGYIRHQCSVCKIYSEAEITIKASGHAWGKWKVIKEPTYRSVGIRRTSCTVCGSYIDEEIPMIVVPVEKIVIVPEEDFTIYCKKTDRLQANVFPEEAAYTAEIVWKSSNPKVVEVSEDGTIVAKTRGTATITASTKDGSVTATRKVTVEYSMLQWIIIYLLFGWIWYL